MGEDLSVSDNYARESAAEREARQQAAVAYRNYIAHCAARLEAESMRIAGELNAGAAEMTAMTPAHWRQPFAGSELAATPRISATAQPLAASTSATALDLAPPVARRVREAPNQGVRSFGMGGLKEAPGADAFSVHMPTTYIGSSIPCRQVNSCG